MIQLVGRLREASNATFLASLDGQLFVYKPVAGEAPLWDFPSQTLGRREVAAFGLSRAAGFDVVPPTRWIDEAPHGPGSLQEWVEADGDPLVDLVVVDEVPPGWAGIVVGVDEDDNDLALVHANHDGLRRLALFDLVANNADRKGAHVIRVGQRALGVDHGVSFHVEPKLRTTLWGWSGEPFSDDEVALLTASAAVAAEALGPWLAPAEVAATRRRAAELLAVGCFPEPPADRYPIPWPPL